MQTTDVKGFHLSIQQTRLWSLQQEGRAYRAQCAISLNGHLNLAVFLRALQYLIDQHDILRTSFYCLPGMDIPLQFVTDQVEASYQVIDLESLSQADQQRQCDACFTALQEAELDIEYDSLLYIGMVRRARGSQVLLLSLPSLCADSATLSLLVAELCRIYTMLLDAEQLDEAPLQYADVSGWQNNLLDTEEAEPERQYWRQVDLTTLASMQPPFAMEDKAVESLPVAEDAHYYEPQLLEVSIKEASIGDLRTLSQLYHVQPADVLLALWLVCLWRLSAEKGVTIGVACDGRNYEELTTALGPYTRFVPCRFALTHELPFEQVVTLVNLHVQEAEKRQAYFTWEGAPAGVETFPVSFDYQRWPASWMCGTARLSLLRLYWTGEPSALTLRVLDQATALHVQLHYDPYRLGQAHVQRLAVVFSTIVEHALASPQQPIEQVPLLRPARQVQMLRAAHGPQLPLPSCSVHQLFEEQARLHPEWLAVQSPALSLTYRQLNTQANQLAWRLAQAGVGPNVLVGLCLERSALALVGLLAVLKAGGAYVPLDAEQPAERINQVLQESQVRIVVTQSALRERLSEYPGQLFCLDEPVEHLAQMSIEDLPRHSGPQDLAYVIYTSGSTGVPKGVQVLQQGLLNYSLALLQHLPQESGLHFATVSTLAADLGNTAIYAALVSGGCVDILDYQTVTSAPAFARWAQEHPIDVLKIVPSHLWALLASEQGQHIIPRRVLILGGEALPDKLLRRLEEQGAQCAVLNHYGPTETTVGVLVQLVSKGTGQGRSERIALGRPLANCEVYVLDEQLHLLPAGIPGEICLAGTGLARGYGQRAAETAERFVPHPWSQQPGARLYRTGDVGLVREDGRVVFLGRKDGQVKVRGYRVELAEIERALAQADNVRAAVVQLQQERAGGQSLVAYVVAQHQSGPRLETLQAALRRRLPEYMIPGRLRLLRELPLSRNGKVDRRKLAAMQEEEEGSAVLQRMEQPRSPLEEALQEIWQELLGVPWVGIHENFFRLGGHSLLATQVISQIRARLQVEISILSLFAAPTVAELARRVERGLRGEPGEAEEEVELKALGRGQGLPLSFAQQRLWVLDQLEPGSVTYLTPHVLGIEGALEVQALERSLAELVQRHEILRTSVREREGQVEQWITPGAEVSLPLIDLAELQEDEQEVRKLARQEGQMPIDLAAGPWVRMRLLRRSGNERHVLLLTLHHIATDGWSNGVFVRELNVLYQAFRAGHPSPLAPLPIQYADFAVWQRQWLQGERLQTLLTYWKRRLAGLVPLDLPLDYPRPPVLTSRGAFLAAHLPLTLRDQLVELSQQAGVTLFMTLLAAFQVLLMRYSGQTDIAIGTPIANRTRAELEGLIGFFVNTLVLRTNLAGNPTFSELLTQVREVALNAYAHQDIPFERVVEELHPQRDLSRSPLFQVSFSTVQHKTISNGEHTSLLFKEEPIGVPPAKFDVDVNILNSEQSFLCGVIYNTDLFAPTTMQRLLTHFQLLLEGIVARPAQKIADLPLLTPTERQQLLVEWNATQVTYTHDFCLHELFEQQVKRSPEAIAVVCEGEHLTYAELDCHANQLAHYLQRVGVGPEVPVGVCMERSNALLIGIMGILKAGGYYVPLDPAYPQERLAFMVMDAGLSLVVTQHPLKDRLPDTVHVILLDADWPLILQQPLQQPSSGVIAANLAYVIYTSGSTGRPKGVLVSHRGLVNYISWCTRYYEVAISNGSVIHSSIAFDLTITSMFAPLIVGRRAVLAPEGPGIEALASILQREKGSLLLKITPAHLEALNQHLLPDEVVQTVHALVIGGEALAGESLAFWRAHASATRLINEYGPTEAAVGCCIYEVPREMPLSGNVSIGRPIANTQLYALDAQLHPVPIGVAGELYIGGVGLARGYWQRADLTAERFVPDPFSQVGGARLYRTGDQARYREDGNLDYLGRRDEQVKLRGYRIELGEIEAVLSQHAQVKQCVVVLRGRELQEKQLVAYVVPREGQSADIADYGVLAGFLKGKLPAYMIPAHFVILAALPLTPNGKIDRNALPVPATQRALEQPADLVRATSIEELLVGLWCEVLKQPHVERHDNFFTLGGHSLLATQLLSRIRSIFRVELPLRSLFEAPTLAELASRIEDAWPEAQSIKRLPLVPVPRAQALPLSFAQQRLWFIDQLEPGNTAYNISLAVRFQGDVQLATLEQSVYEIVKRHEGLRTVFQARQGQPVQIIQEALPVHLPVIDVSSMLPASQREAAMQHITHQEMRRPFDLARGPLWRMTVFRVSADEHVLLLIMHHIISDGWSINILVREMSTVYRALVLQEPVRLPQLPIQYADFAYWQRQWLQGDALKEQIEYWAHLLNGCTPLKLPMDHPRPARRSYHGAEHPFSFSPELSRSLSILSRQAEVTLFMTLLAAFQTLLYLYTGQTDIVVGTDMANRTHKETESLIGFFINILALRNDVSGSPSFREVLKRTRELVLDAYAHQDAPFEMVVERVAPHHSLDSMPLVQVLFVLHNQPASHAQSLPGVTQSSLIDVETATAKFDLALFLLEGPEGLKGMVKYSPDLFERSSIVTMIERFTTLLQHIVTDPDISITILNFYTEAERARQGEQRQQSLRGLKKAKGEALSFPRE